MNSKIFHIFLIAFAVIIITSRVPVMAGTTPTPPIERPSLNPNLTWIREGDSFCHNYLGGVSVASRNLKTAQIVYGNLADVPIFFGVSAATACFTPFPPPSGQGGPPAWGWAVWYFF